MSSWKPPSSQEAAFRRHTPGGAWLSLISTNGFMDMVVGHNDDPPLLLHNGGGTGNHFLNFKLVGTKSNRDGMGARIRVGRVASRRSGRLRAAAAISRRAIYEQTLDLPKRLWPRLSGIKWPSRQQQVFHNVDADRFYLVEEGRDRLDLQKFGHPPVRPTLLSSKNSPADTN
jgi:hypothetical protein